MIHCIDTPIGGNDDDVEMIMEAALEHQESTASSDGIIKYDPTDTISSTPTTTKRQRTILAVSIGLLIGTVISILTVVSIQVRNNDGMMEMYSNDNNSNNNDDNDDFDVTSQKYTSILQEEAVVCPKYPRPKSFLGKKGVAMQLNDNVAVDHPASSTRNLPIVQSVRPYWNYGWSVVRSTRQPNDIEWVPMVWGGHTMETVRQRLETHVVPHIQSGSVHRILGYNEPDTTMQSNMTVERALELWPALESTSVSLVSPSCAQPGREWMTSFMTNVTNTCRRVDWVAVHWYGSTNFISFRNTIRSYYYMYGRKPILITEFASADFQTTTVEGNVHTREKVLSFMKKAIPWLESRSWIVGYAWFSYDITDRKGWTSALFDQGGQLTPLGQYYASVRKETPNGNQTIRW